MNNTYSFRNLYDKIRSPNSYYDIFELLENEREQFKAFFREIESPQKLDVLCKRGESGFC